MAASTSTLRLIIQALDEFSVELNKLSGMVDNVAAEVSRVDAQADRATQSLTGMAQTATAFQQLGIRLAAVGAALTASVVVPVQAAAEFERALDRVVAVTDGAQNAFKALERTASELGRTTRFTATEAAEGMRYLGMAGFDAAQTMAAIGPSLELAAAGQMSLAESADIATNIMTAMKVPVQDLNHVVDVLAKTSTSSNTSVIQMAEALKYTAPLAQSAGVTLEQVSAAIGVLGNNGIQASLAGTSLRGMLLSLAAPTKKARDTLASMGVVIARNQDGTIDLIETLRRLRDANITLAESNALFLRRSAAGALALAQQVDEVERLNQANINAVRSGTEMYNLMEGNLIGAVILLQSAFNGLLRSVGEPLLKPIEMIVRGLAALTSQIAETITEFPTLTRVIATTIGVIGTLTVAVGALSIAMAGWIQVQRSAIIVEMVAHWKLYTTAIKEATVATVAFFTTTGRVAAVTAVIDGLLAKLASMARLLVHAFKVNPVWAAITTLIGLVTTYGASVALFTKSTDQLIDSQKKLGAELDKQKKTFKDLTRAMDANRENAELLAETTIKLRTYMLEVAEAHGALSFEALEVANSIDILTGKFTDGEQALDRYREALERQKFETMARQVGLYAQSLQAAQGDTFWASTKRYLNSTIAQYKEWYMWVGNLGGLLGKTKDYTGEVTKEYETQMRMAREQTKLFAREALAAFEQMGQIDLEWTETELIAVLRALGVTYQDAIDIYIDEFNRFRDAHKDANQLMLDDSVFKDDATVQHFREAVNQQIAELDRLKQAQLGAVASRNVDAIGSLMVEIDASQDALSEAMDRYEEAILNRRVADAEESMKKLKGLQDEYRAFRDETQKMIDAGVGPEDPRILDRAQKSKDIAAEIEKTERDLSQRLDLIRQENLSRVVKQEEERTQEIERNEKLQILSTENAERERLQSSILTADARLRVYAEERDRAVKIFGPNNPVVMQYSKNWLAAIEAVKKAQQAAADYEIELMNKQAGELGRAAEKAAKAKLQAAPDSVQKFRDQAQFEIDTLKESFDEQLKAGEVHEKKRQAQIKHYRDLERKYLAQGDDEAAKRNLKKVQEEIASLEERSKQYLESQATFEKLKQDVTDKYKQEEIEYLVKQEEKKQREILERMRAELEEKKKLLDEEQSEYEYRYQEGEISLEQYYENRRRIISEKIDAEIALLEAKLAAAKTDEEKLTLTAQIKVKRTEETIRLGKEDRGEGKAAESNERAVQNALIDIRRKATQDWEFEEKAKIEKDAFDLRQQQELDAFKKRYQEKFSDATTWEQKLTEFINGQVAERADFERQQELDLEQKRLDRQGQEISFQGSVIPEFDVEAQLANERDAEINSLQQRLVNYKKFTDDKTAIAKMTQQTEQAIAQAQADYELKLNQHRLSQSSQFFGDMSDMFGGLYEASGKKLKAFAKLQKATAIAQTIIETFKSAQQAYAAMSNVPYVGPALGAAAAAAAVAQGMARVYAIQAQPLATGGRVEEMPDFQQNVKLGKKTVPIKITAKEWKFPKERVAQYGPELFDALREGAIPKVITDMMVGKRHPAGRSVRVKDYGEVPGFSPHPKADNIDSYARPGDYVLPVDAAKNYGRDFMQALSQGKIPSNWIELFLEKTRRGYSDGGEVEPGKERVRKYVPTRWIDILYEQAPAIRKTIRKKQPRYSEGGEVGGRSPHPKADNIPIWATAEEWVMPVKTVRQYGKDVMAAIQEGLIPAEVFKALRLPTINIPSPPVRYAYASGGPVNPAPSTQPTTTDPIPRAMRTDMKKISQQLPEEKEEIAIYNVVDPRDMDRWAASSSGARAILNVISSRSTTVRRILR